MIGYSPVKLKVWLLRERGLSLRQILDFCPEIDENRQILTCLRRTAVGLYWEPGISGGTDPYLCDEDLIALVNYITDNARDANTLTVRDVLDAARELKRQRAHRAVAELVRLNNSKLTKDICLELTEPSRSWVNDFCLRNGLKLAHRTEIERSRLLAGCFSELRSFLKSIEADLAEVPDTLLFNADETMLSGKRRYKGVTDAGATIAIGFEIKEAEHLTAMITVSAAGALVPPFFILHGLSKLPQSLQKSTSRCWFGSSLNGWMTRYTFVDWTVNFCNWLSLYRQSLPSADAAKPAMLILDGHLTRLNPAAIDYFRKNNVRVVILPPHSTHILQPFDVLVASSFKSNFKKNMSHLTSKSDTITADTLLVNAVKAAIDACNQASTFSHSVGAFERPGIRPFNPEILRNNPYVLDYQPPEPNRRPFTISGKVITRNDVCQEIWEHLRQKRPLDDDTMRIVDETLEQRAQTRPLSNGRPLTPYHHHK